MHTPPAQFAYLGLGTNLGDRLVNLERARQALPPSVRLNRASSIYQTLPWGYTDQPEFLNQVVEVCSSICAVDLLANLKKIEAAIGRRQTFRYGPRVIDMDILLFGDQVIDLPGLQVPHPRLAERAFMLVPLAELAPHLRHPLLGLTISQLLNKVDPTGVEVYHD